MIGIKIRLDQSGQISSAGVGSSNMPIINDGIDWTARGYDYKLFLSLSL
jgi:hypothetical protein